MAITTDGLINAIDRLVVSSCANYDNGICLPKDRPCRWREINLTGNKEYDYPFSDKGITCPYLLKAVLPGDKRLQGLYEAYLDNVDGKRSIEKVVSTCERCKTPIAKTSNRQKYCSTCKEYEDKRIRAARKRKSRAERG